MTLPSYPSELPRPNRDGYRNARGDGRATGRTDAGPPIRGRRRFSAVHRTVSFSTDLTLSQKARLDRFVDEDTAEGSLPFLMPDWAVDGTPLLTGDGTPLLTGDGTPLLISRIWLCLFDQLPAETPRGVLWRVTFSLLVLP